MDTLLTLIRHGQSTWNAIGRAQGHAPVPLSDVGRAQARLLAEALARHNGYAAVDAICCSDLLRCRQTVAPVAEMLAMDVRYDARLREINVGTWQGLTIEERQALDPEHFAAFQADRWHAQIPGGESHVMMAERVLGALDQILVAHQNKHVMLIVHGGPIHAILRHFDLWSDDEWIPIHNTSRTVLSVNEEQAGNRKAAKVLTLSDTSHLPPELVT